MSEVATKSIGEVIADLRKARGNTQQRMAERIGVSTQAVSKWETGASLPDVALLPAIADYLEVSIDRLFDRDVDAQKSFIQGVRLRSQSGEGMTISEVMRQCWAIHLGFGKDLSLSINDANRMIDESLTSRIVADGAISKIRNGLGYVFLPDPDNGWKSVFNNAERLTALFRMLSDPDMLRLIDWMIRQDTGFTPSAASSDTDLTVERCEELLESLRAHRLLTSETSRTHEGDVETFKVNRHLLPILLIVVLYGNELLNFREAFNYYLWNRSKQFE